MPRHWSDTLPEGQEVQMAFLAVDLAGSTDVTAEDRRNFHRTVEQVVLEFGGAMLSWHGDGTMGFFYDPAGLPEAAAFRAGRRILERLLTEHGLTSHLGLHAGRVAFHKDLGREARADALNQAGHLGKIAPPQMILLAVDVGDALPESVQAELGYFGTTRCDGVPCLSWPRKPGAHPDPKEFVAGDEDTWKLRCAYIDFVRKATKYIRLVGPRQIKKAPTFEIQSIFVPPELSGPESERWMGLEPYEGHSPDVPFAEARLVRQPPTRLGLLDALARYRALAIVGDPGSGKTTILRWLAHVAASGRRTAGQKAPPVAGLVPILAPAGEVHAFIRAGASFVDALARYWERQGVSSCGALFARLVAERKALVLLDGLDELHEHTDRVEMTRAAGDFARLHPEARIVVTSRRVGFEALALGAWEPLELLPFGPAQIERLARSWFVEFEKLQTPDDPAAEERGRDGAERFLKSVELSPGLKDLLRNPFLLTLACLVQRQGYALPRYRVELYDLIGQTLIETWGSVRSLSPRPVEGPRRDYKKEAGDVLRPLARHLHENVAGGLIAEDDLIRLLAERMQAGGTPEKEARDAAERFLKELRNSTHLLIPLGPEHWGFMHLTFQEFFAAKDVIAGERVLAELVPARVYDPRWREAVRLVAGLLGVVHERPKLATDLIRGILEADHPVRGKILRHNLWLAADCLADAGGAAPELVGRIVDELTDLAVRGRFAVVRRRAAKCLAPLQEVAGPAALDRVINALSAAEAEVRSAAAEALGAVGADNPNVVEALLGRLEDAEPAVREASARALGAVGAGHPKVVEALLGRLEDADPSVRWASARTLGAVGAGSPKVVDALFGRLEDADPTVRRAGAEALGAIGAGHPNVVEALLGRLEDADPRARWAAAKALGAVGAGHPNVVEVLLGRLEDAAPPMRWAAAQALGAVDAGNPKVVAALLGRLEDANLLVRWAAAWSLHTVGADHPKLVQALLRRLEDTDPWVRLAAARTLGAVGAGHPNVVDALFARLQDTEAMVREWAAWALGTVGAGHPNAVDALLGRLEDTDPRVREMTAWGLGRLGGGHPKVVERLLGKLEDPVPLVREAAALVLDRLTLAMPV